MYVCVLPLYCRILLWHIDKLCRIRKMMPISSRLMFMNLSVCFRSHIASSCVSCTLTYVSSSKMSECLVPVLLVQARRYAESLDNAVWTNQFDNTANRRAHLETTGPEIWQQTGNPTPPTPSSVPCRPQGGRVGALWKKRLIDVQVKNSKKKVLFCFRWFGECSDIQYWHWGNTCWWVLQ